MLNAQPRSIEYVLPVRFTTEAQISVRHRDVCEYGAQVVCPLHNHAFRLADGLCTTGDWSVQVHQVVVEDGEVVLRLNHA